MLKEALIASKLAGGSGGGSGNLPTPSAANVGSGLVSQKKTVAGAVIVPEQTVTFDEEGIAILQGNPELFVAGTFCVGHINDYQISGVIEEEDWWLGVGGIWYNSEEQIMQIEGGEQGETVSASLSVASYEYEYALDPYAGYDVVIRLNSDSLIGSTSGTVEKGDITAVEAKGLAGVPITVLVYGVNGDPDFPYTRTFSIVSCYWNNYDAAHDDHHLDMVIAECEPWNARVDYRRLCLYTTGNVSFTNFQRKVDLTAL